MCARRRRRCFPALQLPLLQPGDVLVLDNASIHNNAEFKAAVRARGATLLYTPPYTPQMAPVRDPRGSLQPRDPRVCTLQLRANAGV